MAYTYRVLVRQAAHLLYLDIPLPTEGIKVSLAYGDTGLVVHDQLRPGVSIQALADRAHPTGSGSAG